MLTAHQLSDAMAIACSEARLWIGATSPNPAVGAVALNHDGIVVAKAAHERAGELHAEARLIDACRQQGILSTVSTLCVTLEPCNHVGRTPACTETILKSGISHVAVGTRDNNPKVAGHGIERLRGEGIKVTLGINESECQQLISSFAFNAAMDRPWVTVKRAFNAEGSMIPSLGHKTFTSTSSLQFAHRLRKKADAILTGSGTIVADRPLFTVRHVNDFMVKRRYLAIIDRRRRVSSAYLEAATTRGLIPLVFDSVDEALLDLRKRNVQDILVEAGPGLSDSILQSNDWTMSIDIQAADLDEVTSRFNETEKIPFTIDDLNYDFFLPA